MPYLKMPHEPVAVDVCDRIGLKQRAVWAGTNIMPDKSGGLRIELLTRVDYYQPDTEGGFGEAVKPGKGITSRPETLIADNDTAVYFDPLDPTHPRTGEALYFREGNVFKVWGTRDEQGRFAALETPFEELETPMTGQGDLFGLMMASPIIMNDLVRQHITAANLPPYNRFA